MTDYLHCTTALELHRTKKYFSFTAAFFSCFVIRAATPTRQRQRDRVLLLADQGNLRPQTSASQYSPGNQNGGGGGGGAASSSYFTGDDDDADRLSFESR